MVPVDLSGRNERALRAVLALAREAGSRVTLFHVIQRVPGLAPGELEKFYRLLVERSERKLREVARFFTSKGCEVSTQVRIGEPAAEIVRATLRERVDLVVVGSHKVKPGRRERGWGTTSYKVGIFCQCPRHYRRASGLFPVLATPLGLCLTSGRYIASAYGHAGATPSAAV
jgi:nucleotide-binding universal stress UspA family protein